MRCAITSSSIAVGGVGCGGLLRNFLHGAGIGFCIDGLEMIGLFCSDDDGLEMVVFCCSDVDGLEMVVFCCSDIDGLEMVVFCCSDVDGLQMVEFVNGHICWQMWQYILPCDSIR